MHDKAAAADVAGVGEHHFEREPDRDGRIDGVAPLLQDLDTGLRRQWLGRDHHGVRRRDRL